MKVSTIAAGLFAALAAASAASAARIDLEAYDPRFQLGASLAVSDQVVVELGLGTLFADDLGTGDTFDVFVTEPSSAVVSLVTPDVFDGVLAPAGGVAPFAIDATSAAGLFVNIADPTDFRYLVLSLPDGEEFDFQADSFSIDGAVVELFDIKVVPLPAALPLMLAGLGALAVAARRRVA